MKIILLTIRENCGRLRTYHLIRSRKELLRFLSRHTIQRTRHIFGGFMSNLLTNEDIKTTLKLFHQQLDIGKPLNELPLKAIDWNSSEGLLFLRDRCRKGNYEDIIRHFKLLRLNEKTGKLVMAAAVRNGVNIEMLPMDLAVKTTKGKEKERNELMNTIIECGGAKEFLTLLRSDRTIQGDKKYETYDYVVAEYNRRGLGRLPSSDVVFGKDLEDEKRDENERKKHITKEKMEYLTKQLKENGINGIKMLWRIDNGLGILIYPNIDDVKDYPAFTEALKEVIDAAIEKDFEEVFKCTRTFPLLYGSGAMAHVVPDVVDKAFKKYPMMLKSIERTFLKDVSDREKQDYFFFTKLAVTNPNFDWDDINLAFLPEDGITLYNEKDEPFVLSLREQLDELVISAYEAGIPGSAIPQDYASYHNEDIGALKILVKWRDAKNRKPPDEENSIESKPPVKQSFLRRIFGRFRSKPQ
jgi:hypothetical protein